MSALRLVLLLLVALSSLEARQLLIKTYTTADGLPQDYILCIVQDSHGYLWFCTAEGLSRFDGYSFKNYTAKDGLPASRVSSFVQGDKDIYWVATTDGVCRFDPAHAAPKFRCYPTFGEHGVPRPWVLLRDRSGAIWAGSSHDGLYRLGPGEADFSRVLVDMHSAGADQLVNALLEDRSGDLWIGSPYGLSRRKRDGTETNFLNGVAVSSLAEDRGGGIWAGTSIGLACLQSGAIGSAAPAVRWYREGDGLPSRRIISIAEGSDGTLWVSTAAGLAERKQAAGRHEREFEGYAKREGLPAKTLDVVTEDHDGNLWVGTSGLGIIKIAHRRGVNTFTESDGLAEPSALVETRRGELCAVYRRDGALRVALLNDTGRFTSIRPRWPAGLNKFGWGERQIAVEDHTGEWWFATARGLYRFPQVGRLTELTNVSAKAVYTKRDGLLGNEIFRIYEDRSGDIWIGTIGPGMEDSLARWERSTGKIRVFSQNDGLPRKPVPTGFAEDKAGNLWVCFYHGDFGAVARFRNGRFQFFSGEQGVRGHPETLFADSAGRIWLATSRGLVRFDNPGDAQPKCSVYTVEQGLASDDITGVAEDSWGRIYVTTRRGLDRFEPVATGLAHIKHYATSAGLAPGALNLAYGDRMGRLWFGSPAGLTEFIPAPDRHRVPPAVFITAVSVAGVARPISDLGQTSVREQRLPHGPLRIDYAGLEFSPGETLRYQYKLEGPDRDWSPPTEQRTVLYANLSAGSYRFLVRSVASDGTVSASSASVDFTIPPPFWRSWWFSLTCALAAAAIIYALHRYRMSQVMEIVEVRSRIATDLHDDIGASLSQIAVLSEVAQKTLNGAEHRARGPLGEIANISRELVDSLSDIVWAINPEHDRLSNLVYRMRRLANDIFAGQGAALEFRSDVAEHDLRIAPHVRRQLYLFFKEAVRNAARHSGATRVEIDFSQAGNALILRVADNGKGFDPDRDFEGCGLANMQKRAASLAAKVAVTSVPGTGATVSMTVNLSSLHAHQH